MLEWQNITLEGGFYLLGGVGINSLFFSFILNDFQKKESDNPLQPFYSTTNVLLQPTSIMSETNNHIPTNAVYGKSVFVRACVWLLIAIVAFIPFINFL
jgi:hypothetical protein